MMTLSEAIRLGAMLRPRQAFYVTFDEDEDATCALGAAAEAVGILDLTKPNRYSGKAPKAWKAVCRQRVICPACSMRLPQVDSAVIHLNNEHRWTREQIADWVESVELATVATTGSLFDADFAVDPVAERGTEGNTREKTSSSTSVDADMAAYRKGPR